MIEIREVSKSFDGFQALREVSLTVPTGAIYGFIGPNGAGKTTTLKIIGTLLRPDAGTVRVMETDALTDPTEVRRLIGWMPDQYGVYTELRVWEYLDFFAGAHGLPRSKRRDVTALVLDLVGLAEKKENRVGTLSRGMTQRLCLGRALLHEPPILLLDEPASGLDPQARIELRELLRELQRMGKTILVSSHILPELAEYCTGVAIIQDGRLIFSGPMEKLAAATGGRSRRVRISILGDAGEARRVLESRPEVVTVAAKTDRVLEVEVAGEEPALAELLAGLVSGGVKVCGFQEAAPDLGDLFLKITSAEGNGG